MRCSSFEILKCKNKSLYSVLGNGKAMLSPDNSCRDILEYVL